MVVSGQTGIGEVSKKCPSYDSGHHQPVGSQLSWCYEELQKCLRFYGIVWDTVSRWWQSPELDHDLQGVHPLESGRGLMKSCSFMRESVIGEIKAETDAVSSR